MTYRGFIELIQDIAIDKVNSTTPSVSLIGKVVNLSPLEIFLLDGSELILTEQDVYFSKLVKYDKNQALKGTLTLEKSITTSSSSSGKSHDHEVTIANQQCIFGFQLELNDIVLLTRLQGGTKHIIIIPVVNDGNL